MIRKILAIVFGVIVAVAIVTAVEALGHSVYPVPADLNVDDRAQFENYLANLPIGAFMFVISAWVLGTFGGGLLACFIAKEKPFLYASIIGGVVLAATVVNLILISHPLWSSVTAVIGIAVVTYLAGLIGSSKAFAESGT